MFFFRKKNRAVVEDLREPCGLSASPRGDVYILQNIGGWISAIRPDGHHEDVINTGGSPAGSTVGSDGDLYVADSDKRSILRISQDGDVITVVETWGNRRLPVPGDLTTGPDGTLYFSARAASENGESAGYLFSTTSGGDLHLVAEGLREPRGLQFTPNRGRLVVAESGAGRIVAYAMDDNGEVAGEPGEYCELREHVRPAGLAFDADGRLYVCLDGAGSVVVLDRNGKVEREIAVPGKRPTSLAFGGPDRKTLYIAEAETGQVVAVPSKTEGV